MSLLKKPHSQKLSIVLSLIVLIVLGFISYFNSLKGDFIWDDHLLVKDNVYIKSFNHIDKIFTKDLGQGVGVQFNFYRHGIGVCQVEMH